MLSHFVSIDSYQHQRSSCFVFDFAKLNLCQHVFTLNFSSVHVNISYFCNLHMWINTIIHVPYCPCTPLAMCPITSVGHLDLCIIMPICPIIHVPHCPCLSFRSTHYYAHMPHHPFPMCPIAMGNEEPGQWGHMAMGHLGDEHNNA